MLKDNQPLSTMVTHLQVKLVGLGLKADSNINRDQFHHQR